MSIIAQGVTFKVRLDVEGAKADLARAKAEDGKTEEAARRPRLRTQRGNDDAGFFERYFSLGAGGLGFNSAALFSKANVATAAKVGMAAAVVAATVYAIDYAAEHGVPSLYARSEGMLAGTADAGLAAASRESAERNAKDVARHRAENTQYLPSISRADEHFENVAMLGGKPPTWSRKTQVEREQYEMLKYREQMDSLKERMREQITKRFWGRYTTGILGDAIKSVASMW